MKWVCSQVIKTNWSKTHNSGMGCIADCWGWPHHPSLSLSANGYQNYMLFSGCHSHMSDNELHGQNKEHSGPEVLYWRRWNWECFKDFYLMKWNDLFTWNQAWVNVQWMQRVDFNRTCGALFMHQYYWILVCQQFDFSLSIPILYPQGIFWYQAKICSLLVVFLCCMELIGYSYLSYNEPVN